MENEEATSAAKQLEALKSRHRDLQIVAQRQSVAITALGERECVGQMQREFKELAMYRQKHPGLCCEPIEDVKGAKILDLLQEAARDQRVFDMHGGREKEEDRHSAAFPGEVLWEPASDQELLRLVQIGLRAGGAPWPKCQQVLDAVQSSLEESNENNVAAATSRAVEEVEERKVERMVAAIKGVAKPGGEFFKEVLERKECASGVEVINLQSSSDDDELEDRSGDKKPAGRKRKYDNW